MDSRRGKNRMNVEGDRLSSLPDDLIHKILSFIGIKQAIKTSALSSRWRYIWTSMHRLNFSSEDFHSLREFSKFVTHVLSTRNNQTEVHSINLVFCGKVSQVFVKRILEYAFSHNVQQMNITCLLGKKGFTFNLTDYPLSIFSSQSLKNLTLSGYANAHFLTTSVPTWYLPALTTLNFHFVALFDETTTDKCAGMFSNCANLKNLTFKNCKMDGGMDGFNICHDGLSNLTLEGCYERVNVVTPQLKNLTIINWSRIHLVSAPDLASLYYEDDGDNCYSPLKISTGLLHLEKVDVRIQCSHGDKAYTCIIVCLLQQLRSVKFLTLNLELVKLLSSSMELISHQPSPFTNLKSLKIHPIDVTEPEVTMSTEVKNYLLDGSKGATFTLVSYAEVRAVMNVASAQKLMRELQVLLDQWKENSEQKTTEMEQDNMATVLEQVEVENQPDTKMKWHFGERMTHIESYWEGLNEQLERGYKNTRRAIAMLRKIEGVLAKLPTSRRDKLQAWFSGLCAEAETIMDDVMDRMNIQCDKKPKLSS